MVVPGHLLGEFMRETLLQLSYLRYELAQLKGSSPAEALKHSTSFMDQNFEVIQDMLEQEGMDWNAFEEAIQTAAQRERDL